MGISGFLGEYNSIVKETEKIYRDFARALGLSESAFWILYTLREEGDGITQREMVHTNYLPAQTINSALKKLEAQGYVELKSQDDKRKKQVFLTKAGEELSRQTADRVMSMEANAAASLTKEEQAVFLAVFRKYTDGLKENLAGMNQETKKHEQYQSE